MAGNQRERSQHAAVRIHATTGDRRAVPAVVRTMVACIEDPVAIKKILTYLEEKAPF